MGGCMGRYLDGWEDAQSRGSSRNGGRGGRSTTESPFPAGDVRESGVHFHFSLG
ncbi:unnamed protein product [Tetraodon nigroviridis]|uniref:Chromosome 2 SCAF10211, whole genome shotgun sequence n=1 Tax=Tetraodon nigroviridis TaxID=99883 RepID=Q4T2R0_TETNG|nr:unnamed protein product [Tetraodon nigroviridis]